MAQVWEHKRREGAVAVAVAAALVSRSGLGAEAGRFPGTPTPDLQPGGLALREKQGDEGREAS